MDQIELLVVAIISYLLGSISFARLVSRLVDRQADLSDISLPVQNSDEKMPMLAMGANTASIKYGPKVGCTAGALDILKVFLPTLAVRLLYPGQPYELLAAVAGFIGHCWPIYYRFKGGRGISAFYGAMLAIDPLGAFVVAGGSMLVGMVLLKELLFAYTGGVLLAILWFGWTRGWGPYVIYAVVSSVLFIVALTPEIRAMRTLMQKHGKYDMRSSMATFPMGQAMLKLMETFKSHK